MSTKGRVVAIYHKETRKVLGYVPVADILAHTYGTCPLIRIAYKPPAFFLSDGLIAKNFDYEVVHNANKDPIKVIAANQKEADVLMAYGKPDLEEKILAVFNKPNSILEGMKA